MTQIATLESFRQKIPKLYHYLLIFFAFTLPISVAINNIAAGLILLLWLVEGNFKAKYLRIIKHPLAIWSFIFLFVHIIGLLWTNDLIWGMHMIKKEAKFLLLPIFLLVINKENIKTYFITFFAAMAISEFISYLIWFDLIPPLSDENKLGYATPFIDHLSYAPYLAFTIYVLLHQLLFDRAKDQIGTILSIIFILTMSFNLFISGGRAGQVGFFVIYTLIVLQYFHKNIVKAMMLLSVSLPLIFMLVYTTSPGFEQRVDLAIQEIKTFENNPSTSVGKRITFFLNSLPIIQEHPFLGVGTGDFREAYAVINAKNSPSLDVPDQPHNMYILVLTQLGLFGFIPLMMLFYTQIKASLSKASPFYRIQMALPILFMVLMLSDSYLLGHHTTMLFLFFSAILFLETTWQSEKS